MPSRTPSTAWVMVWSGRPREALTCQGTRTAHVDLAQRGLQARAGAGGKRVEVGRWCVRTFTDIQGDPGPLHSARPMSPPVEQASCDTARHIRSICGQMRGVPMRTTRGRRQHHQRAKASLEGRLSRHLRRRGARRARQRRAAGVQGACGAAVLMGAHGAAHDVPSAERAEGLWL